MRHRETERHTGTETERHTGHRVRHRTHRNRTLRDTQGQRDTGHTETHRQTWSMAVTHRRGAGGRSRTQPKH